MLTTWENNGEPNDQGEFVAVVDLQDGSGVQRFKGKTHKEVADKLLVAQANATQKIRQFTRTEKPDPITPRATPKPLDADERFKLTSDLQDPAKAPEAVNRIVEAAVGAPLSEVRQRMSAEDAAAEAAEAHRIGVEWAAENPDWYVHPHNGNLIGQYMQMHNMAVTKKNFTIAFEALKPTGLLIPKPEENEEPEVEETPEQPASSRPAGGLPAQPPVTTRPRGEGSTGLRAGNSSAGSGRQASRPKYTRQQIEAMPQAEYKDKYDNEPGFRQLVDSL